MAYQYTPIHTLTEPAVGSNAPGLLLMAACSFPRARYFLGPRSPADAAPGHLVCGVAAAFLRATTAPVQWRSSVLLLLAAPQPPPAASRRLASPRLASPRLASPRLAHARTLLRHHRRDGSPSDPQAAASLAAVQRTDVECQAMCRPKHSAVVRCVIIVPH